MYSQLLRHAWPITGILLAPFLLERLERGQRGVGVDGGVDRAGGL